MGLTGKSHATTSPCHRVTVLVSHLPCPCHQTSQSFALPSTNTALHHHVTVSPHHCISQSFALPLPPNQSVICLAHCHQTSQSFALPSTIVAPCHCITVSPHHHITASPHHHMRFSPPHGYESDWLILPNTVLIG